jgi:hypothetical protein
MLETLLADMERRGKVEDRSPVLDAHHSAGGKRPAIADAIDLVEHRHRRIARPEEVGMERVDGPVLIDGSGRGYERLARHLSAEDSLAILLRGHAAENVDFDRFEIEKIDEVVDIVLHQPILPHGQQLAVFSRQEEL